MADHDEDSVKLALLAHDLRTPLSAMRLTAELIGNGQLDVSQTEHLSVLIRSIDALTEMTGALVHAAEPDQQTEKPVSRIADVVAETADLFRVPAEVKGLFFEVSIDDTIRGFKSEEGGAIRRVMSALLDNAIKYTGSGGVSVSLGLPGQPASGSSEGCQVSWVSLVVTDSGPGLDADERERLFRPFVRGRHGRNSGPGSGLGLWGTAQLVKELGGRLTLSAAPSGGCRFEVQFPVKSALDAGEGFNEQPEGKEVSNAELQPACVLIVDDNDTNCRLLAALLESFGIRSEIANSGEQAISLVQKVEFDAVLLDLHMPGMSGVETAMKLHEIKKVKSLPLIAVSAAADAIGKDQLKQAGFNEVLTKPLIPRLLYEALEKAQKT
ncbi:MAG: hybrid sensor histidine kinase/response regulator [Roseibium sp.]|uniref:ATP-binding response regulator n=1 Tax=Roseibium sp. TaxID=1936156 RepID=UPI00261F9F72|nr:hybrid sensor histidine kinase/response regulator [Roseibium sp.]MCV0429560.1 hybrid sensor histidine kinase/response regulator [Roseibium sp.]